MTKQNVIFAIVITTIVVIVPSAIEYKLRHKLTQQIEQSLQQNQLLLTHLHTVQQQLVQCVNDNDNNVPIAQYPPVI